MAITCQGDYLQGKESKGVQRESNHKEPLTLRVNTKYRNLHVSQQNTKV